MQKRYFARGWVALCLALICTVGLSTVLLAADEPTTVEPGLLVAAVDANGPAAAAGVKRGDIVLAVDGTPVNSLDELLNALAQVTAGASVTLQIQHGDAIQELVVPTALRNQRAYLGLLPYVAPALDVSTHSPAAPSVQATIPGPTVPAPAAEPDLTAPGVPGAPQLVIVDVLKGSAAATAGLQPQDVITAVNGEAVSDPATLHKLVNSARPGESMTLTIVRGEAAPQDVEVVVGQGNTGQALLGVKVGVVVTTTVAGAANVPFAWPALPALPELAPKFYHFEVVPPVPPLERSVPGCVGEGAVVQDFVQLPPDTIMIAPAAPQSWVAQPALPAEQNTVIVVQGRVAQDVAPMPGAAQQEMVIVTAAQPVAAPMQVVVPDAQDDVIILNEEMAPTQPVAPVTGDDYY